MSQESLQIPAIASTGFESFRGFQDVAADCDIAELEFQPKPTPGS